MNKLLSFVVPVYNVAAFLPNLLDSFIKIPQHFLSKSEFILVNDGSTDESLSMLREFKNRLGDESIVRILDKENGGLSEARNQGLSMARGDYVWFVDPDDIVNYKTIGMLFEILESGEEDLVQFSFRRFQNVKEIKYETDSGNKNLVLALTGNDLLAMLADNKVDNFAWAHIARRSIYLDNSIEFPVGKTFEDIATTFNLFIQSSKCKLVLLPCYYYRSRTGSIMQTRSSSSVDDMMSAVHTIADFDGFSSDLVKDRLVYKTTLQAYRRTFEGAITENMKNARARVVRFFIERHYRLSRKEKLKILFIKFLMVSGTYSQVRRFFITVSSTNLFDKLKRRCAVLFTCLRISARSGNRIIFFGVPTYGNVGDIAIARATMQLFRDYNKRFIWVNDYISVPVAKMVKSIIRKTDVVLYQGGGNFGDMYPIIDAERRSVFLTLKDTGAKMIQLPTSVNFRCKGDFAELAHDYYGVRIFVREPISLVNAKDILTSSKISMIPDMVFWTIATHAINMHSKNTHINTVAVALRSDEEKSNSPSYDYIIEQLIARGLPTDVRHFDTVVNTQGKKLLTLKQKNKVLNSVLREIDSADLIITDRLHGMLLSLSRGKKVIALDNSTKKISGTIHGWLANNPNVFFIDSYSESVKKKLDIWLSTDKTVDSSDTFNTEIQKKFDSLMKELKVEK